VFVDGEEGVTDESPTVDVTAAESSEAPGVEKSILEHVTDALASKEASPTSKDTGNEQPQAGATEESESAPAVDPKTEIPKAELKHYSPTARHRIRELVAQKNEVSSQIESLRPKADGYDRITAHCREHDISPQDFDNAIEVTRLVKHEPERALEALIPLMQELYRKTGKIIPPELRERVRLGHLQEQDALALTQAQARERLAAERAEVENRRRAAADQDRQKAEWDRTVASNAQTATQWDQAKTASDPDWLTKQPLVAEQMELELRRAGPQGFPKNGMEVAALLEKSLKAVETRLKSFQPRPQQIKPVNGQGASSRATAEPKDAVEAARMALQKLG
jgi:hypothetical protein